MLTAPFRTMDDVVDGLAALEAGFRQVDDRRAVFLTLYGIVSAEIRARIARGGFEDTEWVRRYMIAFADLYRVALLAYETGDAERLPKAWRLAFDAARAGTGLVVQDLLLGVNAHVNADLPHALSTVSIEPDRPSRYRDHTAVNATLADVVDRATRRIAELYAPVLDFVDQGVGPVDEMLGVFSLEVGRESAWEAAVSLANARSDFERRLITRLISTRAAAVARLLLAPSHLPARLAACRQLEQRSGWILLISGPGVRG
jgi:hypothetical protein